MNVVRIRELVSELNELLDADPPPVPSQRPDEVMVVGKVARPEFGVAKGKPRWTAGISYWSNEGQLTWLNCLAWGDAAKAAQGFRRGDEVSVIGKFREETFVGNDGTLKTKQTFIVSRFATEV